MVECMESKDFLDLIVVSPLEQLECIGQLASTRKCHIFIHNPTNKAVTYKVKATSPAHIKLRPGYGYLKPNVMTQVQMTVMPMTDRSRPPSHEHISILLAEVPSNCPTNPQNLWRGDIYPKEIRKDLLKIKFVVDADVNGNEQTHEMEQSDDETSKKEESGDS